MKDFRFGSKDESELSYYVFIEASRSIDEHAFFRYDTLKEAMALFEYQVAMHPSRSVSLGVHKNGTRRADIIERIGGINVLSDDYKRISPWKDDPLVAVAVQEASERLDAKWKVDRWLVDMPVFIPNERTLKSYVPWYLEGKTLFPKDPNDVKTSIVEVKVDDVGWVSIDDAKVLAKNRGYFNHHRLMVSEYLVSYQTERGSFRGTMAITPAEYAFMKKCALEKSVAAHDYESLDSLKLEAKERAQETNLASDELGGSCASPSRREILR